MQGKGDVFRRAVYRAFFVEGRNIPPVDELALIAEAFGLPGDEARVSESGEGPGPLRLNMYRCARRPGSGQRGVRLLLCGLFFRGGLFRCVVRVGAVFGQLALQLFLALFLPLQFFLPFLKLKIRFCHRVTPVLTGTGLVRP